MAAPADDDAGDSLHLLALGAAPFHLRGGGSEAHADGAWNMMEGASSAAGAASGVLPPGGGRRRGSVRTLPRLLLRSMSHMNERKFCFGCGTGRHCDEIIYIQVQAVVCSPNRCCGSPGTSPSTKMWLTSPSLSSC